MFTEADLLRALRDCYDPVLPCNIVDLGLIQALRVAADPDAPGAAIPGVVPKYRVAVDLIPTTQGEAAAAQLAAQIANRLAGLEAVSRTAVTFLERPVWTPGRITPAGRKLLGLDGNPHLIQIAAVSTRAEE